MTRRPADVTSDLPVLREILSADVSALMPAPGDADALAQAIRRLAADPALRISLACAAQSRLRDHTWERRAQHIAEFLGVGLR
jgi:glycosyltransferase involved in cell wall biosynthesis